MTEQQIIEQVLALVDLINARFPNRVATPDIRFFRDQARTAGTCARNASYVTFNLDVAEAHPDKFISTIIHEVAHVMQIVLFPNAKQHHGPEFRKCSIFLGGDGSTYCSYVKVEVDTSKRVLYTCACNSDLWVSKVRHNRIVNGTANYRCAKCQTRIFKKA